MPAADPVAAQRLRVLAHPLRLRLLSLLTARALSGSEAARELGDTQANVSYHLRRLHAAGLVEPVHDRFQRGRTRRYRHDPASGERLHASWSTDKQVLAAALAGELQRRAGQHRPGSAGAFTDAELWVTPDAWARALAAARQVGVELHRHAVAPGTTGALPVSATVSLFEMNPATSVGHPARPVGGDQQGVR